MAAKTPAYVFRSSEFLYYDPMGVYCNYFPRLVLFPYPGGKSFR